MPSQEPIVSVPELLNAFGGAVFGRNSVADLHRGADYDMAGGVGAVLFHRVSIRGRDLFRQIYFSSASGDAVDTILAKRWSDVAPRSLGTRGQGTARVARPTSGSQEKWWKGTRIAVIPDQGMPIVFYRVAADSLSLATDLQATLAVEAEEIGPDTAVHTTRSKAHLLRFDDVLTDPTWYVDQIDCEAGKSREADSEAKARARQERRDNRVGYPARITQAMTDAGAAQVALFASDYLGVENDFGLNRIYVADESFTTPAALLRACRLALPSVVIAGTSVQALPMASAEVGFSVTVNLWDAPSQFARHELEREIRNSIVNYFEARKNAFYWREVAIRGAILHALSAIQAIQITATLPEPTLATLFDSIPLIRYTTSDAAVNVTIQGPV